MTLETKFHYVQSAICVRMNKLSGYYHYDCLPMLASKKKKEATNTNDNKVFSENRKTYKQTDNRLTQPKILVPIKSPHRCAQSCHTCELSLALFSLLWQCLWLSETILQQCVWETNRSQAGPCWSNKIVDSYRIWNRKQVSMQCHSKWNRFYFTLWTH